MPFSSAIGGTGVASPTAKTVPINQGASPQTNVALVQGQCMTADGSGNPVAVSGCRVLLNTLTASNSATVSDTTSITSAFNEYEIVFESVIPVTANADCEIQVHSGGGFQSTGYFSTMVVFGNTTIAGENQTTRMQCSQTGNLLNAAPGISGRFTIYAPSGVSVPKHWTGAISYRNGSIEVGGSVAGYWNNNAAIDGFQVLFSSGNIASGVIKVYGMK
jgi:hypothetical protein